jgi:hypothetical protein
MGFSVCFVFFKKNSRHLQNESGSSKDKRALCAGTPKYKETSYKNGT